MENTIDKLHAQQLDAVVKLKAKEEERKNAYQKLHAHIISVLTRNLDMNAVKVGCSHNSGRIEVANRGIDLYFEKPYHINEGKERVLRMNFCCFGSFGKDDAGAVKYCEVLGQIAGMMGVLETELFRTDEAKRVWDEFDSAQYAMHRAADTERSISNEIKHIEDETRKASILPKITAGCKIMTMPAYPGRNAIVKTIEKVTSKNVIFKEDWGQRTKKEDLLNNLVHNRWTIV